MPLSALEEAFCFLIDLQFYEFNHVSLRASAARIPFN